MKPLELTVYPKLERPKRGKDIMAYRSQFIDERLIIQMKRLTDAELAAEYYRAAFLHENSVAENDGYDGAPDVREHRRHTRALYRFATLPHYDQEEAQA